MSESGSPARRVGRVRRFVGIVLGVVVVLSFLVCLALPHWGWSPTGSSMVGIILVGLIGLPGLLLFDSGRKAAYVADRDDRAARLARKYAPLPWVLRVEGGSSCRLMSPSVVIGSRPKSDDPDAQYVDIDDPGLAPTCARLDLKGDTWYVTDLRPASSSSTSGVVVPTPDGIPVTIARDAPAPVYGDIKIGRLTLRVESTTGSTSTGPSLTDPDWGSSASVGPPDFSQSDQSTTGSSFGPLPRRDHDLLGRHGAEGDPERG
ncbi:MAG: hypothetical protein FWH11_08135 [Micrococcales bacterium]|nr:hypothetical protein [Micrococcales bacterium]